MSNIILSQSPTTYNCFIYPESDNTVALQIYPASPTTHFDKIDDQQATPNDDTDYIFCNTIPPAKIDMYDLTVHPVEATGIINYIQVFTRASAYPVSQSATGEYKHKITCGTGNALSVNMAPVTTTYQPYSTIWTTRPADGLAWTWTDIDALLTGVSISSPAVTMHLQKIFRPNAAGIINQLDANWETGGPLNYTNVDEEIPDDMGTFVNGESYQGMTDAYNIPNHTTESGTITAVTLYFRAMQILTGASGWASPLVYIGGTYYYGTEFIIPETVWTDFFYSWTLNPNTSTAWTWTDIDNLQIGLQVNAHSRNIETLCTQLYAVVVYTLSAPPEIRVTQQYIMVNYSPSPSTVTLLAPSEVRYSNQRRTERVIFPDGTYCIGDHGRASKTMTMPGSEATNAIQKMRQVQAMLSNPSSVTISGLLDVNQDIAWRLKNFDYEYDIGGDHYDWTAEFAAYDVVGG